MAHRLTRRHAGSGVPVVLALNVVTFTVLVVCSSRALWRVDYEANVDDAAPFNPPSGKIRSLLSFRR